MLYLSDASLQYAVARCKERENYRVGIATHNKESAFEKLTPMLGNEVRKIKHNPNNMYIKLNNGSDIRFMPISEYSKGFKIHLLIVDESVDDDFLKSVLLPCETLEEYERLKRRNNIDIK